MKWALLQQEQYRDIQQNLLALEKMNGSINKNAYYDNWAELKGILLTLELQMIKRRSFQGGGMLML